MLACSCFVGNDFRAPLLQVRHVVGFHKRMLLLTVIDGHWQSNTGIYNLSKRWGRRLKVEHGTVGLNEAPVAASSLVAVSFSAHVHMPGHADICVAWNLHNVRS